MLGLSAAAPGALTAAEPATLDLLVTYAAPAALLRLIHRHYLHAATSTPTKLLAGGATAASCRGLTPHIAYAEPLTPRAPPHNRPGVETLGWADREFLGTGCGLPARAAAAVAPARGPGGEGVAPPGVLQQKRGFVRVVHQGWVAYRLTFGREPELLKPGLHMKLPIVHKLINVNMRETGVPVEKLHAYTKDNVPVTVSGTMFYRVLDAERACFAVTGVVKAIKEIGTSALRSVVGTLDYDEVIADRQETNERLSNHIGKATQHWGIECTKFEVQQFDPQNAHVASHLEKQMEAERNRRQQELDTLASVNMATGQRDAAILHSEGQLQATKNKADAQKYETERQADAARYAKEQEAEAWAAQINRVSQELEMSSEDATKFILEVKRLEALGAIAAGPNNTAYFFPNSGDVVAVPQLKVAGDMLAEGARATCDVRAAV